MIWSVLYIMLLYFLIGGIAVFFISRRKQPQERAQQWRKYFVYLFVVSLTILLTASEDLFPFFCMVLLILGIREVVKVAAYPLQKVRLATVVFLYLVIGAGFILFSMLPSVNEKLWVYTLVFVMDGFSQISGQIFGRRKLITRISPMKTVEGFAGGMIMCIITGFILVPATMSTTSTFFLSLFIALSALTGDLIASWYKRLNQVKDYGTLLPGHGGILDRFDSFITSASLYYYFGRLLI